jgi:hypothetical protein
LTNVRLGAEGLLCETDVFWEEHEIKHNVQTSKETEIPIVILLICGLLGLDRMLPSK